MEGGPADATVLSVSVDEADAAAMCQRAAAELVGAGLTRANQRPDASPRYTWSAWLGGEPHGPRSGKHKAMLKRALTEALLQQDIQRGVVPPARRRRRRRVGGAPAPEPAGASAAAGAADIAPGAAQAAGDAFTGDAPGFGSAGPLCWKCRGSGTSARARGAGADSACAVCAGRGRLRAKRKEIEAQLAAAEGVVRRRRAEDTPAGWRGAGAQNMASGSRTICTGAPLPSRSRSGSAVGCF